MSGSVNLNAPITRLAVSQIAAKAMGLSISNLSSVRPFTDTTDPYVQALNACRHRGGYFSNGTSTFKPYNTLTRGQISAIVLADGASPVNRENNSGPLKRSAVLCYTKAPQKTKCIFPRSFGATGNDAPNLSPQHLPLSTMRPMRIKVYGGARSLQQGAVHILRDGELHHAM